MDDETIQHIQHVVADLRAEITRLRNRVDQYEQNGLYVLRTRNLDYHAIPYVTEAPTETDKNGSPRLVRTGTGPNTYEVQFYTPDGWLGAALS